MGWQLLALLLIYAAGFYDVAPNLAYLHRFFLPVFAPVVLLAVFALHRAWRSPGPLGVLRLVTAASLLVAVGWDLEPIGGAGLGSTLATAGSMASRMVTRARVAAFIGGRYSRNARVLGQDLGMIGYALLNPIDDGWGLNDEVLTHRFKHDDWDTYARYLLGKKPELVVLASTSPSELSPLYDIDKALLRDPRLGRNYKPVFVALTKGDNLNYVVYARGKVPTRAHPVDIALDETLELGPLIESVAQRTWAAQRSAPPM